MEWIKAIERLPDKRGRDNEVIIRGENMPNDKFGHGIRGKFIAHAFVNFDEKNPTFYFEIGGDSYLSNEGIEWLDESNPPSDKKSAEEILEYMKTGAHEWDVFYDPQRMSHYTDGEIYERFVEHLKTIIDKSEEYKNQFTVDKWAGDEDMKAAFEVYGDNLDEYDETFDEWLSNYRKDKI